MNKRKVVKEIKSEYFNISMQAVEELGLACGAFLGYLEKIKGCVKHVDDEEETWYIMSDNFITKKLGISINTARKYINMLSDYSYIKTKTTTNKKNILERHIAFIYDWPEVEEVADRDTNKY